MSNVQTRLTLPAKAATTFTVFPNLAPELRLKIWQHACFPRTVLIRYLPTHDICRSSTSPPAILQVCHEAREEGLRIYVLSFGTHSSPARTYFNPYRDILYLPRHMAMGYDETLRDFKSFIMDREGVLDEVRRIAIDHVDEEVKRPWEGYNKASLIRGFKKLEEVVLVLCQKDGGGKGGGGWGKEVKFVEPRESVEKLLGFWVDFRQSFLMDERGLEEFCRAVEREYERFVLPTVRIKGKLLV